MGVYGTIWFRAINMYGINIDHLDFATPTALALALADRVAAELSVSVLERKRAIWQFLVVKHQNCFSLFVKS